MIVQVFFRVPGRASSRMVGPCLELLIQAWDEASEFTSVSASQVMLTVLFPGPCFEKHCCRLLWPRSTTDLSLSNFTVTEK